MIVVGLTGSIAMGKSETAKMFATRGIPVFDSDAAVHRLYGRGGEAVAAIAALAPSAIDDGSVDRRKLATLIQTDPALLPRIEAAVHPLVRAMQSKFLSETAAAGVDIAVLDIPLLFEMGREKDVDVTLVVSAGDAKQRERALQRPGMTADKLDFILSRQVPDVEKRTRADYVISTSTSLEDTAREVDHFIEKLRTEGRDQHGA